MERISAWLTKARDALDFPLLTIGEFSVRLWSVLYLVVLGVLLVWFSGVLRRITVRALRRTGKADVAAAESVGTILRYAVVVLGTLMIVQSAGIDLTTLNVLAGAVGIGIGFGLQNIASNFISGIILLVGRPIKLGDRIEVADVEGDVVELGARATTVLTNDNIALIVPNSLFVSEIVVNWSHNDQRVRFRIPVSVAYGSDLRQVETVLIQVAANDADVLVEPAAAMRVVEFSDSGVKVELLAWTDSLSHRKGFLVSRLNFGIYNAFRDAGIKMPFPQRVVHLRGAPVEAARPPESAAP